jgi:hypothetical protein
MPLHNNCIPAWIVFTQRRSHLSGGWGEPITTGDVYTDEVQALKCLNAASDEDQIAWVKRATVHNH